MIQVKIYRTAIWSGIPFAMSEARRLRVFDSRVLRDIHSPKREEVKRD
jgi:hypothetical protein